MFEDKIKKHMELYLRASSNVISMNSLNTIIANAMEKSKLEEASFYDNDLFSSQLCRRKLAAILQTSALGGPTLSTTIEACVDIKLFSGAVAGG